MLGNLFARVKALGASVNALHAEMTAVVASAAVAPVVAPAVAAPAPAASAHGRGPVGHVGRDGRGACAVGARPHPKGRDREAGDGDDSVERAPAGAARRARRARSRVAGAGLAVGVADTVADGVERRRVAAQCVADAVAGSTGRMCLRAAVDAAPSPDRPADTAAALEGVEAVTPAPMRRERRHRRRRRCAERGRRGGRRRGAGGAEAEEEPRAPVVGRLLVHFWRGERRGAPGAAQPCAPRGRKVSAP